MTTTPGEAEPGPPQAPYCAPPTYREMERPFLLNHHLNLLLSLDADVLAAAALRVYAEEYGQKPHRLASLVH